MGKNTFKTPLVVEVLPSGKTFKLHFSFVYLWKREHIEIQVRAGFVTDFASIPRIVRIFISKLGRYNKAAVIHDAMYQDNYETLNTCTRHCPFTRKDADLIFLDAMKDGGTKKWKATAMYLAVRAFAWLAWRKREVSW